jgi:two-component system phosphate regulon sensor histidine kinase PhoR
MTNIDVDKLAALVKQDREALLTRWRSQVRQLESAKDLDQPTLTDHMPMLLDELVAALQEKADESIPEAHGQECSTDHGLQRVADGFDIEEVVAEYNILRACIHDLADKNGLCLQGKPFHIVNRVLDCAIGIALRTFATQKALEVRRRREEYLAFVAHDLRTPLNAISLAGRVLELSLPSDARSEASAQMLRSLHRNVQQLEVLVDKVLEENSHLETESGLKLERRMLDLWPLVESLIHDLHPVAGTDSTRLINEVPEDLVVYADANLLRRVFQNLIANAIKYTPLGEVAIEAKALPDHEGVECSVRDNGAGIPAELREKIFEKGQTDPDLDGGMGLGLAVVKTFVEGHGGTVDVESTEGHGSTFRFVLPGQSPPAE